jgi:tetratricopeptide (TPR) repeat protein
MQTATGAGFTNPLYGDAGVIGLPAMPKERGGKFMAKGAKLTRKQLLKEPDQFITTTGRMIRWARSHRRSLVWGTGAFLALVVALVGYAALSERLEQRAHDRFRELSERYSAKLESDGPRAAFEDVKEDFESALDSYGGKDAAVPARFAFADICMEAREPELALRHLRQSLKDFEEDPFYRYLVLDKMGHAYLALEAYPRAIEVFEQVAARKDFFLQDEALFLLGGIYEET